MPYMPDAPVTPDTDPQRMMPVPPGFPPRRTEEAPPLDDWQLRYVSGFSFYMERYRFARLGFLFGYQSPMVVFPMQAISNAFYAIIAWALAWWLYFMAEVRPEDKLTTENTATVIIIICLLIIGFVVLVNTGRSARMNRWVRYEWESFDDFARCEAWMQFVGFLDLVASLGTTAVFLVFFLRG